MKKNFTFILSALLFCSGSASAQSFAFFHKGIQLNNGDEITITKVVDDGMGKIIMESDLEVHNLTNSNIEGKMNQTVILAPEFGQISFCFGNCLLTNENAMLTTLVPVGTTTSAHLTFEVEVDKYATSKVKYTVSPQNSFEEGVSATVNYQYTESSSSINNSALSGDRASILQKDNNVEFVYDLGVNSFYKLVIYNSLGKIVTQKTLTENNGSLDLSNLAKGVYIYSLNDGSKFIKNQKFIVR